jgi:hypothetical protein
MLDHSTGYCNFVLSRGLSKACEILESQTHLFHLRSRVKLVGFKKLIDFSHWSLPVILSEEIRLDFFLVDFHLGNACWLDSLYFCYWGIEVVGAHHPSYILNNSILISSALLLYHLAIVDVKEGRNRLNAHLSSQELVFVEVHL